MQRLRSQENSDSTLLVASPTQCSCGSYIALLPQLEPKRFSNDNVQTKSEARCIVERSLRNSISHILAVAITHYQVGLADNRNKNINKVTLGAI